MLARLCHSVLFAALLSAVPLSSTLAQGQVQTRGSAPVAPSTPVIVVHAPGIVWSAGPPSLPPGAEFALLEGNPAEAGPLTLRLRFPANYSIPPHWHSVIEHVTVLSGRLYIGMGESVDRSAATVLTAGDFGALSEKMVHTAWTDDEPVNFQLHSVGPWSITYVNPKDDPRKRE